MEQQCKEKQSAIVTASVAIVQKPVRSAVEENVQSKNFIIHGGEEEEPTEWNESGFENFILQVDCSMKFALSPSLQRFLQQPG